VSNPRGIKRRYLTIRMKMQRILFIAMLSCFGACERHVARPVNAPTVSGSTKGDLKSEREAMLIAQVCLLKFPADDLRSMTGLWPFSEENPQNLAQDVRTDTVFLAFGRNGDDAWIIPDHSIIEQVGSEHVASVAEAGVDDTVLSLENLSWQDDRVVLDISTYHRKLGTHGNEEAEFVFEDGEGKLSFPGGCYFLPLDGG
jgi:hypothetical protein